jgi:putative Mg2+ transporter-C (MgtC) family protein
LVVTIPPEVIDTASKLAIATVLGGILGLERERKHRAAGLRTHIVVCIASTLAIIISNKLAHEWLTESTDAVHDRGRIIQGILQGIGFLGAGAIINVGSMQRGLTTAAMIWFVAILGIAVGLGYFGIAVIATIFALAALLLFEPIGNWLSGSSEHLLHLKIPGGAERVGEVKKFIEDEGCFVDVARLSFNKNEEEIELRFRVGLAQRITIEEIMEKLIKKFTDLSDVTVDR